MSIIEKALQKLQKTGQTTPVVRLPPPADIDFEIASDSELRRSRQEPKLDGRAVVRPDRIAIDLAHMRSVGVLAPEASASRVEDEYRRLKWPLLNNAIGQGNVLVVDGNLIMVASSLPGEGKTTTAINLALSIAQERDCTVLLVDADVAKPHVSDIFGLKNQAGLIDVLLNNNLDVSDVLVKTDNDGLRILAAGSPYRSAPELLASNRMKNLIRELAARYSDRIIVFDSPPLLETNEAQVLAGLVGQIILIVQADKTPQPAVQEAIGLLDPTKAINLVLNQSRTLPGSHYHGGYYGYKKTDRKSDERYPHSWT